MGVPLEHLLTHLPAEPRCIFCIRAKATREPARRVDPNVREQETYDHDFKYLCDWVWIVHIVVLCADIVGVGGKKTRE